MALSADSYLRDMLGLHPASLPTRLTFGPVVSPDVAGGPAVSPDDDPDDPLDAARAEMMKWLAKAGRYEEGQPAFDAMLYVGMATLEAAKGPLPLHECAPVFDKLAEHKLLLDKTRRDNRRCLNRENIIVRK